MDLEVPSERVVAVVGPNGAGKTTLLRIAAGRLRATEGEVEYDRRVSLVPEIPCAPAYLSAPEALGYLSGMLGSDAAAGEALEAVGLAETPGLGLTYSKGMRRRLNIAEALFAGSDLLILDEPFEGLDPEMAETLVGIVRRLRSRGMALLVSSHNLDLVSEVADSVVFLSHGAVAGRATRGDYPVRIRVGGSAERAREALEALGLHPRFEDDALFFVPSEDASVPEVVRRLVALGIDVHEVQRVDVRDQYRRMVGHAEDSVGRDPAR